MYQFRSTMQWNRWLPVWEIVRWTCFEKTCCFRDGSDEDDRHNCGLYHSKESQWNIWMNILADMPCSSTQFRCPSGLKNNPRLRCLDRSAVCNGIANCFRGEDEANCTRRNCTANQYVLPGKWGTASSSSFVRSLDFNVPMVYAFHVPMFAVGDFAKIDWFGTNYEYLFRSRQWLWFVLLEVFRWLKINDAYLGDGSDEPASCSTYLSLSFRF